MITEKSLSAMTSVAQLSRDLTQRDWSTLEINLVSAMLSKASAQHAAKKGSAL